MVRTIYEARNARMELHELMGSGMLLLSFIGVIYTLATKKKPYEHEDRPAPPPPEIEADDLQSLLNSLDHRDWRVRQQAAQQLGEMADAAALDSLLAKLNDPDSDVRDAVIVALSKLGDVALHELTLHLKHQELHHREGAVRALGLLRDSRAVPALVEALQDASFWVRMPAALALGHIGDPAAIPALEAATKDPEAVVRKAATEALKRMGKLGTSYDLS